jgi:hypothetical protein
MQCAVTELLHTTVEEATIFALIRIAHGVIVSRRLGKMALFA